MKQGKKFAAGFMAATLVLCTAAPAMAAPQSTIVPKTTATTSSNSGNSKKTAITLKKGATKTCKLSSSRKNGKYYKLNNTKTRSTQRLVVKNYSYAKIKITAYFPNGEKQSLTIPSRTIQKINFFYGQADQLQKGKYYLKVSKSGKASTARHCTITWK